MAVVKAFKAIRPKKELAKKVASLPYDVMNREEAKKMAEGNEYSFLKVVRSEIDLDDSIDQYDELVYKTARANLDNMIEKGVLIQDEKPQLYIYRQIMGDRVQTGIVGCTSIDDYMNDIIKKHEYTRPQKEIDRINNFDYCDANTAPVFLTYRNNDDLSKLIHTWTKKHNPINSFISEDNITHMAWIIDEEAVINRIQEIFKNIDYLYIADGHHRAASAVKLGLKRREKNPGYTGNEEYNFFLSVIFPDKDLSILDYNRVVQDINGLSQEEFITKIKEKFIVEVYSEEGQYKPSEKHTFGMYYENNWYKLTAKKGTYDENDPVNRLDVSILQNNVLKPLLGIEDPRTDKRIDFVGGIRGLGELEKRVAEDMEVAFSMYPTTMDDLISIADAGKVMPPKSTWFEPKLRSGLFIHRLF